MKNSRIQISLFVILVASLFFSGCQQSILASSATATRQAFINEVSTIAVQTVIASFPSETPTPSITATPTATLIPTRTAPNLVISRQEILPLTTSSVISKGAPSMLVNAKISLPKALGDYLVYASFDGRSLLYSSPDGNIKGTLVDENIDPALIIQGRTPRFVFIGTQTKYIVGPSFDTASVWETDVFGNLLNSWKVLSGSNMCMNPEISPYSNWIAIDCINESDNRMINLINLRTGDTKSFTIHCDSDFAPTPLPGSFYWSANETEFAYRCPVAEYYFISLSSDHVTAKQLGDRPNEFDILTISPDWTHIAIDMGTMPENPNGTIRGERLMIANLDCILANNSQCNQGITFDLPISEPVTPFPFEQLQATWETAIICRWTHDDNALIWTTAHGGIGQIDMRTNTNRTITPGGSAYLLDISPDDQWTIFFGKDPNSDNFGLFSMSTHDNSITHFLAGPNIGGRITVYGWLTIH